MAQRSKQERLFGAACLRLTLERAGTRVSGNEIYEGTLRDLGLTDDDVEVYVRDHRDEVQTALKSGRRQPSKNGSDDADAN